VVPFANTFRYLIMQGGGFASKVDGSGTGGNVGSTWLYAAFFRHDIFQAVANSLTAAAKGGDPDTAGRILWSKYMNSRNWQVEETYGALPGTPPAGGDDGGAGNGGGDDAAASDDAAAGGGAGGTGGAEPDAAVSGGGTGGTGGAGGTGGKGGGAGGSSGDNGGTGGSGGSPDDGTGPAPTSRAKGGGCSISPEANGSAWLVVSVVLGLSLRRRNRAGSRGPL
jgi:hypothetical protein